MTATMQKSAPDRAAANTGQGTDYAKYLLVFTNEPLAKIADKCGWASARAFTAAFRQNVGVTPAHYRTWHQR